MCGRFVLSSDAGRLADHYDLDTVPDFNGGYNIAPSAQVPVVRQATDREAAVCRWGFIPHWAKDPVIKPINARAETLADKPWFRDAFKRNRCLVPVNGYYEWRAVNGRKQPYFIRLAGADLFSLAGLWSCWQGPDGPVETFSIITTTVCEALARIHDRMPAIIAPADYDAWLNDGDQGLLGPCTGEMEAYPVSSRVNNPRNQGAPLSHEISPILQQGLK